MEIGKQIRKYRTELKLSQDDLADKVYVTRQTISNWENDRNYPDIRFWELAAEEGCSVVIGWDAHAAEHLKVRQEEAFARQMAAELGLNLLENVALQKF